MGVRAIQPWRPDGIEAMRLAQRDSGETVFVADELTHFEDVRDLVGIFLVLGAVGLLLIILAAVVPVDHAAALATGTTAGSTRGTLTIPSRSGR